MGHSLDVHVLAENGDPVTHTRVHVFIEGFWKGGSIDEYTDDDGHAEFETAEDYEASRKLYITVRSQRYCPYSIRDGRWTIQLD